MHNALSNRLSDNPALLSRKVASWVIALALAAGLGACHGSGSPTDTASSGAPSALPSALPLSTATPGTTALAPAAAALPAARPLQLGRFAEPNQGYAYLNRAYYQQQAVESAPPDYAFDAGEVRPWTWSAGNNGRVISEPVSGGYRYYYYNSGQNTPYLVRDSQYAYAYNNGMLAAVYTLAGALVNVAPGSPTALYGARYYDRGQSLWRGAVSGARQPVNAHVWGRSQADLAARHAAWQRQMASNAAWSAWNSAHQSDEQAYWQNVRAQHEQAAQQFNDWQQQRFQGPAPQLYSPPPAAHEHGAAPARPEGRAVAPPPHAEPAPPPRPGAVPHPETARPGAPHPEAARPNVPHPEAARPEAQHSQPVRPAPAHPGEPAGREHPAARPAPARVEHVPPRPAEHKAPEHPPAPAHHPAPAPEHEHREAPPK